MIDEATIGANSPYVWLYYNRIDPLTTRPGCVRYGHSHEQKEHLRQARSLAERSIIIVAPPDVSHRIQRSVDDVEVIAFRNLDELDRWRSGKSARPETIRIDIVAALREIGIEPERLSKNLRATLEAFAHHGTVPAATELVACWPSRRSFYRVWSDEIHEPPSSFLRRIRILHAARLMDAGATAKEAALRAGFGSTDRLRRLLAERRSAESKVLSRK